MTEMLAAVLDLTGGSFRIAHREISARRDGEVTVRVHAVGLCGTDLKSHSGALPLQPPAVLGHEVAGVVAGSDDPALPLGARVALHPYVGCGGCPHCDVANPVLCPELRSIGWQLQGGLAEYVTVPVANAIPLDDRVDFASAALAMDALATTWRALRTRASVKPGDVVTIVGAGGLGLHAVQVARALGAAAVFAVEPDPSRQAAATRLGAEAVHPDDSLNLPRANVVLEVSGTPDGYATAVNLLNDAGRLVGCGHAPGVAPEVPSTALVGRELSIVGSRGNTRTDATDALNALRDGRIVPVIDSRFPLSDTDQAFARLRESRGVGRIIVEITPEQGEPRAT